MGILNVTPDSFADGGDRLDPDVAIAAALGMAEAGADLIDLGGESTRPGAPPLPEAEEWRRVAPVLEGLRGRLTVPISIDTYKAGVADAALAAGASIVNDVSGLRYEPALGPVVARHGAAIVLMHTRGRSREMYSQASYHDVVDEVLDELRESIAFATGAGIAKGRILIDPGLGFAKEAAHSYEALARLDEFSDLGHPILVGASQILTQWLTPQAGADPAQQKMMMIMPVVLIFVFVSTPAGALIYWFVGNIWRLGQMQLTNYIHPPKVRVVRPPAERRVKRVGGGKTESAARES